MKAGETQGGVAAGFLDLAASLKQNLFMLIAAGSAARGDGWMDLGKKRASEEEKKEK